MTTFVDVITRQLLALVPLLVVAASLRLVGDALIGRLVTKLGWKAVYLTGWIGVPVHELSHALVARLFGHRVHKLQLFKPNRRTGRLGVVEHSWDRSSGWQQVGRFCVGIAPLVLGSAMLLVLARWLGPPPVGRLPHIPPGADLADVAGLLLMGARDVLLTLLDPVVWARPATWGYVYLSFAIGAHLSPSRSDLSGCGRGVLILLGVVLLADLVALALGVPSADLAALPLAPAAAATALLAHSLALVGLVSLATWLLTALSAR